MKLSQKWGGKFQRKNFKFLKLKFSPKFGGGNFNAREISTQTTVYETVLTDTDKVGSISGGGRFDNLVGMFSAKPIPAVDLSLLALNFEGALFSCSSLNPFKASSNVIGFF